jgi:hypothetical protein
VLKHSEREEIVRFEPSRKLATSFGVSIGAVLLIACGGGGSSVDSSGSGGGATESQSAGAEAPPAGVYKFDQTVKFDDGSTLKVAKAVKFKPDEYAIVGEKRPVYVKFKATFTNKTKEVYDPSLTTASASADGEEGESVYQSGLGTPDNKVLPGKSVSWWMGYGFQSQKGLQLEVNIGFLDHDTVIFTV